jgi:cytochrome c553
VIHTRGAPSTARQPADRVARTATDRRDIRVTSWHSARHALSPFSAVRLARTLREPGPVISRKLARIATVCALGAGCGASAAPGSSTSDPLRYLDDASFRRSELVESLVDPSNGYSSLRLAHYATGVVGDWDRLPEWNPATEPVGAAELDAPGGASASALSANASPLALPSSIASLGDPALLALGEAAFSRYPTQPATYFSVALASRAAAGRYGLWVDGARGVGGLVRARMADGSVALSLTCASCHAAPSSAGDVVPGLPNAALAMGDAILASQGLAGAPPAIDPIAAWGPGRVDVTTTDGTEPARIPDLRPVRFLTYLQQDATVRARDIVALAIRIETLLITSNLSAVRPPRVVSLALAAYVTSLGASLPGEDVAQAASPSGAAIFASRCTGCHAPPNLTGEPVPLDVVGTDPTLGLSPSRGTGSYRVPSLHGVGTRGALLHDATVPSVDVLFDPGRLDPAFTGGLHGAGPIEGHTFGLDLAPADREALLAYLRAL